MEEDNPNVGREKLYNQVWAEPMSKVAVNYNVSGSYLARICRELNIPTPGRGYWAQLKAEKNPSKVALPTLKAGDPTMWIRSMTSSRHTDVIPIPPEPRSEIPSRKRSRSMHGLLTDAKEIFSKAKTSYSSIFLSPRHHNIVDIVTSLEHLEDSITLAQKLFSRLEEYGYHVLLSNNENIFLKPTIETAEIPEKEKKEYYVNNPWRPGLSTVAYLGTVAIGLTIVEMAESVMIHDYYSYTKQVASRRYRIYAYSPYRHTELVKSWQDTKDSKLEQRLDDIIAEMEVMARQIPNLIIEGEKRAAEAQAKFEAEQREDRRKRALEAKQRSKSESRSDLERLIAAWAELKNRQEFIDQLIHALDEVAPETRNELAARLAIAKDLLGTKTVVDVIKSWKTPDEKLALLSTWERGDDI